MPAWMIHPSTIEMRRESIKTASSASPIGVQSVCPTWFEDTTPKDATSQLSQDPHKEQAQPLHGLKLVIKEEVLPATDQPQFQSLELLASRSLLAPDTWKCKRAQVSLKATIDVPMLGTIIEQNGDGLLEDSHMPVGWPLHIDGAVRQCCIQMTFNVPSQPFSVSHPPFLLTAPSYERKEHQQPHRRPTPLRRELWRNGNALCVKTRQ